MENGDHQVIIIAYDYPAIVQLSNHADPVEEKKGYTVLQ
jgi:hypothetical protein